MSTGLVDPEVRGELPEWVELTIDSPDQAMFPWLDGSARAPVTDAAVSLQVLADWLGWLDDRDIDRRIAESLVEWVERRWGRWLPDGESETVRLARAWTSVCDLAVQWPQADLLRAALRSRLDSAMHYLAVISPDSRLDPLASFLGAAATGQPDRSLLSFWWGIVELPSSLAVRYLPYGVLGLQLAPPDDSCERGLFNARVPSALLVAGRSLLRAVGERRISEERAARTFMRLSRRARAAYPQPKWWRPHVEPAAFGQPVREWFLSVFPELAEAAEEDSAPAEELPPRKREGPKRRKQVDLERWREMSQQLKGKLIREPTVGVRREVDELLAEQRRHAERTGEVQPLVLTLCNLNEVMRCVDSTTALSWAAEACKWQPSDPYTWTTWMLAAQAHGSVARSLAIGLEAIERAPHAAPVWNQLGECLNEMHCYAQAEEAFLTGVERFDDAVAETSLGYLLLAQRRLDEAERWFARSLAKRGLDSHTVTGMSKVFSLRGEYDRAVTMLVAALEEADREGARFLYEEYVAVLKGAGRQQESEQIIDQAKGVGLLVSGPSVSQGGRIPDRLYVESEDVHVLLRQARLLRRAAHRGGTRVNECENAVEELLGMQAELGGQRDSAAVETSRLLMNRGSFAEADRVASDALECAPASLPLLHAVAQVGVESARIGNESFSPERLAELRAPYRRLVEINSAARPVEELGVARAALSLHDGRAADKAAEDALASIAAWSDRDGARHVRGGHWRWWYTQVLNDLLGEDEQYKFDVVHAREISNDHATFLGDLEEDFVLQAAIR